jgi:Lhr-like helicase
MTARRKMEANHSKPEIRIELKDVFSQLVKNSQKGKPFEQSSVCYMLKDKEFDEDVYKLTSRYLEENMPNHCKVEESRKVVVECFYNGHWGYWKFSPILGKVADKSGFSKVERWLDQWSEKKGNFKYNKKYWLWLLKVTYPAQKSQSELA